MLSLADNWHLLPWKHIISGLLKQILFIFNQVLKIFQRELQSEPVIPGPNILFCSNTVYLGLPQKVTHTSTTAICHHLINESGISKQNWYFIIPWHWLLLPGGRCDVTFKFKRIWVTKAGYELRSTSQTDKSIKGCTLSQENTQIC